MPPLVESPGVRLHKLPAMPGKSDVDPLLAGLGDHRLVVYGTDADLAAVVLRLLRTQRLAGTVVGYVPVDTRSAVGRLWDLPTDNGKALDLALRGEPDRVPLIRDDHGGVLLGMGVLGPVRGVAYCDDTVVLRGHASRIEVTADMNAGLAVRVIRRGVLTRRQRTTTGRAMQIGGSSMRPQCDGVPHPRSVTKWTWYRHTDDLRLVRGLL
ncbi:MAG: hypothetical protein J2O49_02885 [Sciscionella sp.]|nr:hypothetical protein [Sciscionella sp.]